MRNRIILVLCLSAFISCGQINDALGTGGDEQTSYITEDKRCQNVAEGATCYTNDEDNDQDNDQDNDITETSTEETTISDSYNPSEIVTSGDGSGGNNIREGEEYEIF